MLANPLLYTTGPQLPIYKTKMCVCVLDNNKFASIHDLFKVPFAFNYTVPTLVESSMCKIKTYMCFCVLCVCVCVCYFCLPVHYLIKECEQTEEREGVVSVSVLIPSSSFNT